jgi:O-antigen ligase
MVENVTLTTYPHSRKARKVYLQSLLILFLVFLALSRWIPGGDPLNPVDGSRGQIMVILVLMSFLLTIFFWSFKPLLLGFKSPAFIVLLCYGVWTLITSFWAPSFFLAFGQAGVFIISTLIMSSIAAQIINYKLPVVNLVFFSMLALVLLLLVINLFEYHSLVPIGRSEARPRLLLAYEHPNVSSTYFAMLILCLLFLLSQTKKVEHRFGIYLGILVLAILLVLTDSRSSMASIFIAAILLLTLRIKSLRLRFTLYALGGFIVSLIFIILLSTPLLKNVSPSFFDDLASMNGRLPVWESLFRNISANNLLIGNGYFSTRYYLLAEISWGYHAHNAFIETLTSTGIIGALIMVAFFLSSLKVSHKDPMLPVSVVFFIYICLESMLETNIFVPTTLMCVFSLFVIRHQLFQVMHCTKETIDGSI